MFILDNIPRPAWNKGVYKVSQEGTGPDEKRCSGCLEVKPLEDFYAAKTCYKGRHNLCHSCWKAHYDKNPLRQERAKQAKARWYERYKVAQEEWIEVIRDPTDFWYRMSRFRKWDFEESLDVWPNGMVVKNLKSNVLYVVEDGKLVAYERRQHEG